MRKLILICVILIICMAASLNAAKKIDFKKDRIPASEFAIFPWGGIPEINTPGAFWGSTESYDDVMKDLWECGFNMSGFAPVKAISYARKYGLSVLVQDGKISGDIPYEKAVEVCKKFLAPYKNDPALLGISLRDEPNTSDFAYLGKWAKAIVAADPDKLPYINLLPNYASNGQLGADSYAAYIDKFVEVCKPKFLSYDNYSLSEGEVLNSDRFYSNLEAMREKALQYNLPFWNIVLGNTHFGYSNPSQTTINVQVFSSLAYGVHGISYFTYYAPIIGNYRLAAIDQFGNKTATWNYIRFMNLQIHKLAPTYLKLKSVNVFHTPNVPAGCKGIESSKYLESISGGDLLVGEFIGPNNTPYAIVVNKSTQHSCYIDVKFKDAGKIMVKSAYTGQDQGFEGENVWLAPGQGMMLFLKK